LEAQGKSGSVRIVREAPAGWGRHREVANGSRRKHFLEILVEASERKLRGQIPASMLKRVIQEPLCRAILGLNVRHDLDIELATEAFLVFLATSV
jgi:hypothetical protein